MEHSLLHAFELIGLVIALGGVFLVIGLIDPARRKLDEATFADELSAALLTSAEKWVLIGALVSALAAFLNLFVEAAEVEGRTIFGGVDLSLTFDFATETNVGHLTLARIAALLLTAGAVRFGRHYKWWITGLGAFGAVMFTSLVSHSAARPEGRMVNITAQIFHITAASLWLGVLAQLLAACKSIEGQAGQKNISFLAEIVRRFSPVALTVTSLLATSGIFMVLRLAGGPSALLTSAYGLILLVKLSLLAPALFAGWINYRIIRPALANQTSRSQGMENPAEATTSLPRRFGRMLELEVTAGMLVIMAAGILASVSPPGESGYYRLTTAQSRALLSPRIPAAQLIDPNTFYGARERTDADLRYAEFTHHWSGVMVFFLGLGWLLQSLGGRWSNWAANGWPLLLVPFMGFVAVASDPEVWLMRRVPFNQVLSDPQLLEHQLGALMILALAWFGWRDRKRPTETRPLGYALPIIFILGGSLLLGHAHSTLNVNEGVLNLINVQHVIFGAFILFAGAVRWLSLRNLFPRKFAAIIWPACICGLGLFMTFFYRETV